MNESRSPTTNESFSSCNENEIVIDERQLSDFLAPSRRSSIRVKALDEEAAESSGRVGLDDKRQSAPSSLKTTSGTGKNECQLVREEKSEKMVEAEGEGAEEAEEESVIYANTTKSPINEMQPSSTSTPNANSKQDAIEATKGKSLASIELADSIN